MKLHFQDRPWDLCLSTGYALFVSGIVAATGTGNFSAIALIFFAPGYSLTAALFPDNKDVKWRDRIILSFALSIVIVPLLGLSLDFSPWGIQVGSLTGSEALLTSSLTAWAYRRRMKLPAMERLQLTLNIRGPAWRSFGRVDKALAIGLIGSVAIASVLVAYVSVNPRPVERFTEFYILGPNANSEPYPRNLTVAETATIVMSIVNHEATEMKYTVRVDLIGLSVISNGTFEVNRTTWAWFNATIDDTQGWDQSYQFSISSPGFWSVEFLLYKDDALTDQTLHLDIVVQS